jgi:hypothetical protein
MGSAMSDDQERMLILVNIEQLVSSTDTGRMSLSR